MVTGTRGKPDVPRSSAQMARFDGEIMDFFSSLCCLQLKNFTVPSVACKEKADPCKFLAVQKFVKGVIVLTRVGTFSIDH